MTEVADAAVDKAKWVTGGKGANLAEMANIGLPVPPGFSISCQTCVAYSSAGNVWPDGVLDEIDEYRKDLEERMLVIVSILVALIGVSGIYLLATNQLDSFLASFGITKPGEGESQESTGDAPEGTTELTAYAGLTWAKLQGISQEIAAAPSDAEGIAMSTNSSPETTSPRRSASGPGQRREE